MKTKAIFLIAVALLPLSVIANDVVDARAKRVQAFLERCKKHAQAELDRLDAEAKQLAILLKIAQRGRIDKNAPGSVMPSPPYRPNDTARFRTKEGKKETVNGIQKSIDEAKSRFAEIKRDPSSVAPRIDAETREGSPSAPIKFGDIGTLSGRFIRVINVVDNSTAIVEAESIRSLAAGGHC